MHMRPVKFLPVRTLGRHCLNSSTLIWSTNAESSGKKKEKKKRGLALCAFANMEQTPSLGKDQLTLQPMPQRSKIWTMTDDWTGVASTKYRRKL